MGGGVCVTGGPGWGRTGVAPGRRACHEFSRPHLDQRRTAASVNSRFDPNAAGSRISPSEIQIMSTPNPKHRRWRWQKQIKDTYGLHHRRVGVVRFRSVAGELSKTGRRGSPRGSGRSRQHPDHQQSQHLVLQYRRRLRLASASPTRGRSSTTATSISRLGHGVGGGSSINAMV